MWRSVGVEKLTQWRGKVGRSGWGRARGTGVSQDTGEVAPVHVLLWHHPRSSSVHTLSWWGCWSVEGSPSASRSLTPSGIYQKVLELHGMTVLASPVLKTAVSHLLL